MEKTFYRNEKIDILRGIAIILVIAGHGIDLLMERNIIPLAIGGVFMMLFIHFICLYFF